MNTVQVAKAIPTRNSKSLPENEFSILVNSSDSGIESDNSRCSSTQLDDSVDDVRIDVTTIVDPASFILGKGASDDERIEGINKCFKWLREELQSMKSKDKDLMKTMINIRSEIAVMRKELENSIDQESEYEIIDRTTDSTGREDSIEKRKSFPFNSGGFPTDGLYFENNRRATWALC